MKPRTIHSPATILGALLALACDSRLGDLPADGQEPEGTDTETTGSSGDETEGDDGQEERSPAVDILFVVDNSGSMSEEQSNLMANLNVLLEVLDMGSLDVRIGFTTTDVANPVCGETSPEEGRLRTVSCLDRLDEFEFPGVEVIDAREICTMACTQPGLATTDGKPWIERTGQGTNLPEGVTLGEAFRCFGLQGINGCGMESPLESMRRMLERAATPGAPEHGFFREGAVASIVLVTDEADCSFQKPEIFDPNGNRIFWSDPTAAQVTSAVCWNAGVECTGDPEAYAECYSTNKGVTGAHGVPDAAAVLYPVSRYIDALENLRTTVSSDVVVAGLVGVPQGYEDGDADLVYSAQQAEQVDTFGIDPGCTGVSAIATPPVRVREVTEAFARPDERNLYSVCAGNYVPALEKIAAAIVARFR